MIINGEQVTVWNEAVVAYLKIWSEKNESLIRSDDRNRTAYVRNTKKRRDANLG